MTQTITDLNTFTANNGLPTVSTLTVNTNGSSTDTAGVIEWNLDSQDMVGAAGGQVGTMIFYNIPTLSNTNLTADINTVVSRNETKIINVSLGECETAARGDGSAAAQDQSFAVGVAGANLLDLYGRFWRRRVATAASSRSWPLCNMSSRGVGHESRRIDRCFGAWHRSGLERRGDSATGGSRSTFEQTDVAKRLRRRHYAWRR
jgi:hypothetical protein